MLPVYKLLNSVHLKIYRLENKSLQSVIPEVFNLILPLQSVMYLH